MAEGYKVRRHELVPGIGILVLAPDGADDFIDVLEKKPKQRDRLRLIKLTLEKLISRGFSASIRGRQIRILEGSIGLAEIAIAGKVIRVMCYVHEIESNPTPVLLFDFDGHQGSDKISKTLMEKGRKLAGVARLCMEEE